MIFCNVCGNPVDESEACPECGNVAVRVAGFNEQGGSNTTGSNGNLTDSQIGTQQVGSAKESGFPKSVFVLGAGVAIVVVALLIYLATHSQNSSAATSGAARANDLAEALNQAIDNQRLITLTNDDAYTYYTQLASSNPQHTALSNAKTKVLPQLRKLGEEIIRRKVDHSGDVSEQDWRRLVRTYEWAHLMEPADNSLEARLNYAQGKLDEIQNRRSEAWQHLLTSTQLDASWAVPQNDLGYLTTQQKSTTKDKWSNAIPYYQRAIGLQPDWEIPYNNMGTAYFYLENFDEAERYYRQAVERNSTWARPHKWLGDIYTKKNNLSMALQEYQTAKTLYNPSTDSLDMEYVQRRIDDLHAKGY
jgi:tetratricopeptide (TPR) repeat protein